MQARKLWTFLLLFTFMFSIVHEFMYASLEHEHHTVSEYVQEINTPSHFGDICDTHFEYHISYILPDMIHVPYSAKNALTINKDIYLTPHYVNVTPYRPPIT